MIQIQSHDQAGRLLEEFEVGNSEAMQDVFNLFKDNELAISVEAKREGKTVRLDSWVWDENTQSGGWFTNYRES